MYEISIWNSCKISDRTSIITPIAKIDVIAWKTTTNKEQPLTAHNWQKWKSTSLTCSYHEIYSQEAVGLKSSDYTLKTTIFVNNYVKFWTISWKFDILSSSNLKFLLHLCDTYNCDYLQHSTFRFYLINFQLNTDYPSQFCGVYRKIT